MIIYKDIVTDTRDELLSDSFSIKEIDGVVYEVDCAMVEIGKNGTDEDGYARKVLMSLKKRNAPDEEVITFKKGVQVHTKRIIDSFNDWEFYTGESMDVDGMVVLLSYREDGITPFVTYWKHGLEEMKV
ncbi:Mss4-like protein [Penicillium canescens]|uniref:Translationally-controlled tumor protein homolog n=1 Tax=Penicillium canescens TaxID=5083 RepID=A0AAD6IHZ1_PENCN|nr:Mss4-like protein [Penicillium canescens]KAJ6050211.1 Mss4-like protein [Penicillium canescens]KAJ6050927.1 Mss4-like protein [Penicillium canescens]KAJ6061433.1 Mss4-like protein [Penicillium canescens]